MCFFEQTVWACGAWRWGTMREQCHKEHRIGETCGLKLVYITHRDNNTCKFCEQISRKIRRVAKLAADIARWTRDGNRPASIGKATTDMAGLKREVSTLRQRHYKIFRVAAAA
jgi:hypothetical protein